MIRYVVPFVVGLGIAGTAHAETNLDVAWKACVENASSFSWQVQSSNRGTETPPKTSADVYYNWSDDALNDICRQVQAEQIKVEKERMRKLSEAAEAMRQAGYAERDKTLLPIIQRGLDDPNGEAKPR